MGFAHLIRKSAFGARVAFATTSGALPPVPHLMGIQPVSGQNL